MKNIKVLYEPEEIREYFRKTFKTQLFRTEMDKPGSLIHKVVEAAAEYPLFIYEFSDHPSKDTPDKQKTEWAHFGAWMGGITKREYPNDAVHDTYFLHELYHKGFMTYQSGMDFDAWKRKIFDNELEASVTSELELYFRHPEFRDQTFPFEILADRYLDNPKFMQDWKRNPERARAQVREQRRDFMYQENLTDPVTKWIHKFNEQNIVWAGNWLQAYNLVETKMQELHDAIDNGVPRKKAMDAFMSWLMSPEITQGTEIPFPLEAEAFAGEYRKNMHYYQKAIAKDGEMPRRNARKLLAEAYPDMDPKKALKGPVAEEVMGKRPRYSGRDDYLVSPVSLSQQGNFAVTYAIDRSLTNPDTGRKDEPVIVFQKRMDKGPNGEDRFGALGGFASLDHNPEKNMVKEQPREGCAREIREEAVNDKKEPVLSPDPKRLQILDMGNDFRRDVPTTYGAFSLELTPEELTAVKAHSEKMQNDPAYAAAVTKASHGEVSQILVKPLRDVLKMSKDQFTHPHEYDAIVTFAQQLQQQGQMRTRAVG